MKRIAALLLTLTLLLAVSAAPAETTAVDFGDFTLDLDENLLVRTDGGGSRIAQYYPCAMGGDTQSVMVVYAGEGATDVTLFSEEEQTEIAQAAVAQLTARDDVRSADMVRTIVSEINGIPFFMFSYYWIEDYAAELAVIPQTVFAAFVMFSLNGTTYKIVATSCSHTVVENWFAATLLSLRQK